MAFIPRYIEAKKTGLLSTRIERAVELLQDCTLCPRNCHVNRLKGETGICNTAMNPVISSYMPHFGEEPPISGINGSGTVFFSHCNLRCCFCQNDEISLNGHGHEAQSGQLASIMLHLQTKGCHNINLVTPTHIIPQFLKELSTAIDHGLSIPIVYNSSGYDKVSSLRLLENIVDIYMPDFKFWDSSFSQELCNAPDYPKAARAAIREMFRQVGDLRTNDAHIAESGLLVRHLVMPEESAGTRHIMKFLRDQISPDTHVNVMSQYRPAANAYQIKTIARPVTPAEYKNALKTAKKYGLNIVR